MPRRRALQAIRFDDIGIARGKDLSISVVYDLENCVIERDGKITGLNSPTTYAATDSFADGKPYFLWNSDLLDADNAIAGPFDGTTRLEVYSGDSFARNLYLSGAFTTGTLKTTNYMTVALNGDYDKDTDPDVNLSIAPAIVLNPVVLRWGSDKYETAGTIQAGEVTANALNPVQTYLFIPYNERGEAGPWVWASTNRAIVALDDAVNPVQRFLENVDITLECNAETDYVEIYSTLVYNNADGIHSIEDLVALYGWTSDEEVQRITQASSIFNWYKRTTIKPVEDTIGGTRYFARWTDNEWLLHPVTYGEVYDQLTASTDELPTELDSFVHADAEQFFGIKEIFRNAAASNILQERRNLLRYSPRRNMRLYTHDGSDFSFDGTNDRLIKDGAGAGQHQIIITGDFTQEISVNDYLFIWGHSTNGWTGLYEVSAIAFAAGETTIRSDNYTSTPSATSNPADTDARLYYFDGGPGIDIYEGVAARTMLEHNGVMLYGNAFVPIGDPRQNIAFFVDNPTGATTRKYGLVFEYTDENNNIKRGPFYGPIIGEHASTEMFELLVPWNGETALQIWKYDGAGDDTDIANYELVERITPSDEGMYFTSFFDTVNDGTRVNFTFSNNAEITRALGTAITYDAVGFEDINYKNRAYLSAQDRPMEVGLTKYQTPVNTTIRAITPTRLAEAEGIQGYDFYTFTDKTVHLHQRDGLAVREIQKMLTNAGIQLKEYTINSLSIKAPLFALTQFGVAFISTDNRVYFISGRQIERLDTNIPGVLGTTWRDIAYHEENDELWVANADNEIWVYSFEDGGWNKNFTLNTNWQIFHLFYSQRADEMLMFFDSDVDGGPTYATYIFANTGTALTSGIATQELLSNGLLFSIERLIADYEKAGYDGTIANMAKMLHYVDARSDLTEEDLLNVTEDNTATPTPKRHEFAIPRGKSVYPTLKGKRHQIKISEFKTLDSIMISVVQNDELD